MFNPPFLSLYFFSSSLQMALGGDLVTLFHLSLDFLLDFSRFLSLSLFLSFFLYLTGINTEMEQSKWLVHRINNRMSLLSISD